MENEDQKINIAHSLQQVEDDVPIIRVVRKQIWIKPDNSIDFEAFRPRGGRKTETGYEVSVSTTLRKCHDTYDKLKQISDKWSKKPLIQTLTTYPNEKGYPCINDNGCHVGITGSMPKLYNDFDALEHIAKNSKVIYP